MARSVPPQSYVVAPSVRATLKTLRARASFRTARNMCQRRSICTPERAPGRVLCPLVIGAVTDAGAVRAACAKFGLLCLATLRLRAGDVTEQHGSTRRLGCEECDTNSCG
jgi:hypothetical protein